MRKVPGASVRPGAKGAGGPQRTCRGAAVVDVARPPRNGSTRQWRKVRAVVLDRDGHVCKLGLPGCLGRASEAHHVRGWAYGDDPEHIVASCGPCNRRIGEPNKTDPRPRPKTRW